MTSLEKMKNRSIWLSLGLSQLLFIALLPIWLQLLPYLHPVVLGVVWICITLFVFFVVYYFRKETIHISKWIIKSSMFIYSLGLMVLLFFRPANQTYQQSNYIPLKTIASFLSGNGSFLVAFYNLAANVLLFVPYGVVILMLTRRRLFFIPCAGILLIEITQHLTRRGSMDIDDLILNLLGVYMGYFFYPVLQKVVKVKSADA